MLNPFFLAQSCYSCSYTGRSGFVESTHVKNATEDPTFVPPEDADGNKSFIERREGACAGVSDEVYPGRGPKVDQKTGNVYTEI